MLCLGFFAPFDLTLKDLYYQKPNNYDMGVSLKGSWPPMGTEGGHWGLFRGPLTRQNTIFSRFTPFVDMAVPGYRNSAQRHINPKVTKIIHLNKCMDPWLGARDYLGGHSLTLKHLKMHDFSENVLFWLFAPFDLNLKGLYYQKANSYEIRVSPKGSWP